MNKIKRVTRRIIASILSVITCISIFIVSPGSSLIAHAEPDSGSTSATYDANGAKATAGAMMQNFANGGMSDLTIGEVTESEFRSWAVLLSNYFIPFKTTITDVGPDETGVGGVYTVGSGEEINEGYSAWNAFMKIWRKNNKSDDTELMYDLASAYNRAVSNSRPLFISGYINGDTAANGITPSIEATLSYMADNRQILCGGWYLYWTEDNKMTDDLSKRHIVFSVPQNSNDAKPITALLMIIKMMDTSHLYTTGINLDSRLCVSPFGDICFNAASSDTVLDLKVLIPACMNPFTFNNIYNTDNIEDSKEKRIELNDSFIEGHGFEGLKLYLNNIFGLSNFIQYGDIYNNSVNGDTTKDSEKLVGTSGLNKMNALANWFLSDDMSDVLHFGGMITFGSFIRKEGEIVSISNKTKLRYVNKNDAEDALKTAKNLFGSYEKALSGITVNNFTLSDKDEKNGFKISGNKLLFEGDFSVSTGLNIRNGGLANSSYTNGWLNSLYVYKNGNTIEMNKYGMGLYSEAAKKFDAPSSINKIWEVSRLEDTYNVVQPLWSIHIQHMLSKNDRNTDTLGINSIAVVGRSSDFDLKENEDLSYSADLIGDFSKYNELVEYMYGNRDVGATAVLMASPASIGGKNTDTYKKLKEIANKPFFSSHIFEYDEIRNNTAFKTFTTLGKYDSVKNTSSAVLEKEILIPTPFTTERKNCDMSGISKERSRFVSIYLGELLHDATFINEEVFIHGAIKADITFAGIPGTKMGEWKYKDEWSEMNPTNLYKLVHFEIPVEKTTAKLGVFGTGIAQSQAVNKMKLKDKELGIYTIDFLNDYSDLNKIFTEYKTDTYEDEGNKTIYLPESLYTLGSSLKSVIRSKDSYVLKGTGINYTVDTEGSDKNKINETDSFTYNAWYFSTSRNLFANIYWAYIEDIVGITAENLNNSLNGGELVRIPKDFSHLPGIEDDFKTEDLLGIMSENTEDKENAIKESILQEKQEYIIDWVYKILSMGDIINNIGEMAGKAMSDAGQYVIGWLKGMIDSLFIGWNNYMLGVDVSAGVTGSVSNIGNSTKSHTYSTAMGYMTTPTFSNLPVTSWIMANFQLIYIIIMIVVVVILIMMVLTRTRRLPQAILIFVCMAFIIVLPANMLNGAIGISNTFTENIYADKFQFWAITQHAEYLQSVPMDSQEGADLFDNLTRQTESQVGGVTLRWMSPKKWGIAERLTAAMQHEDGLKLFTFLNSDMLDAEDFSDYTPGDTYLYRPYYGLFVEAHNLQYAIKSEDKTENIKLTDLGKSINNLWFNGNSSIKYKVNADMKSGQANSSAQNVEKKSGEVKIRNSNFFRYTSARGDSIMRSAIGGTGMGHGSTGMMTYQNPYFDSYYEDSQVIRDIQPEFGNQGRIYAMYSDINLISALFYFNVDDTLFNGKSEPCGLWLYKSGANSSNKVSDIEESSAKSYTTGIKAYFDYSESPYYYFYNALASLKIQNDNGEYTYGDTDFVDLILREEVFKVTNQQSKAYGELKDYLDMEGLFSYVIPLLNQGNQNAQKYFDKYGNTVDKNNYIFSNNSEVSSSESSGVVTVNSKTYSIEDNMTAVVGDKVIIKMKNEKWGKEPYKYSYYYKLKSDDKWNKIGEEKTEIKSQSYVFEKEGSFEFKIQALDSENKTKEEVYNVKINKNADTGESIFKTRRTVGEDLYEDYEQQLQAIWNMYSPWVAQIIAANNKSEKVRSGFGYVELLEPWNPADYRYFGREMAFSPADATVHGYRDYDLSTVETKLHKVLEETYYDILDLVNYKDFTKVNDEYGNDVLISAAAMCATFNFNKEFSDNGFMSTDITLYPQSYELKNMNFDAYLRIILGNSMGVNPVTMKNSTYAKYTTIYEEFIHNTSVWSGLVLVAEDFLAVFVVPLLKIMLIVVIFVLALALAVSCIINKPDKMIKVFLSTFIAPLVGMTAIFMAHSLVISWFIGDGLGSNVIDTHSISVTTGDPTLTLLLMIVVDLVTSILMWKLLKFAAKSTAKYIQDIGTGIAALGKGTFSGVAKLITAAAGIGTMAVGAASLAGGAVKSTVGGVVGAGKAASHRVENSRQTKLDKERNKLLKSGGTSGTSDKTKGKTSGSSGAGASIKSTNNNNNSQQTNSSLAADVKAIRQKLEKGFNPEGMKQESSKPAEAKEMPKKVQAASPEASKTEKKPSAGAQKAQQLYKRKLTRKETQAAAMQSAMTGDNAGLKQAQADLDKLIAEQNALVSKYGATWNKGKKKFTSKSNNAEQNRQLNEMQRKINASRATVNTLKNKAEAAKSSMGGSGKQPRKVMKIKK